MPRDSRFGHRAGAVRCNCLAALICLSALAILVLNFQASPAGAGSNTARQLMQQTATPAIAAPAGPAAVDAAGLQTAIRSSKVALMLHIAQLELGHQRLCALPSYTAKFTKHERLGDGEMTDPQTTALKVRHSPFSVYMKWEEGGDVGREVLFCENQFDNQMLVKLGGIKRALPAVKIQPDGAMAMAQTRYPVTQVGLKYLIETILKFRKRDLELNSGVHWEMIGDQKIGGRPCDLVITEYASPEIEPQYRKCETYVDRELSVAVCVKNYTWPATPIADARQCDEQTLSEFYAYTSIDFSQQLADADFDRTNREYRFKRQ